ncbi:MAG: hypothetical protein ABIN80_13705 [Dyadobacter sp.]|uniref:hypothetical protein n=1 Tax=Dyadobacter sp. TaxID=1914288 RepID=UPI003264886A
MDLTTEDIHTLLDQMPVKRLKAEFVLDELIEAGFCRREDLVVSPGRSSSYFFERDVSGIEEMLNPHSGNSWFKANIPRDGFYDSLPERLFHRPMGRVRNNDEWLDIREEESRQEEDARLFFSPFDNAVSQQLIQIERFEKKALAGNDHRFLREFLKIFWPDSIELELTEKQKVNLLHLTIIAHEVAGNITRMQECFNQMIDDPVKLFYEHRQFETSVLNDFPSMGEAVLGVDAMLTVESFAKWNRLIIQVGPLSYEKMSLYFPGHKCERLLHFLCDVLVPTEIDWMIDLIPSTGSEQEEETQICFFMDDLGKYPVLGYTTLL